MFLDIKSPKKLEESGEDQLTQSPSMGCVPFGFCTEALRTLYIKAVLGGAGLSLVLTPSARAGMGAVWAGGVSPSPPCYCSHREQGWFVSGSSGKFLQYPIKTSFVQRVRGFWAASGTAGPSWCGCLSGCWLMLQTCGENETHQLWPGRIQGCSLILERLRRALQMQLCQKAAEISWPGSSPALLNTLGKSVFGKPHLQIRFWLLPEIHI